MYTTPQMPQELPAAIKPFPSLVTLSTSTIKIWKDGWAIFSLINLIIVVTGTLAWVTISSIMPWIKSILTSRSPVDPMIIAGYYPSPASLIHDLALVSLVLIAFIFCIVISQIMTILALNPEVRHRGLRHLFASSLRIAPRYAWTLAIVSAATIGGMALLVVPGILILPIVMTTIFVSVLENKSGMKAVSEGLHYTKGHTLEALWRSIIIVLAIHGASLILPLLATLPVYPFTLLDFSPQTIKVLSFIAGTIYTFVSVILSVIMPSLLMIFYYQIFTHMKDNPTQKKPLSAKIIPALAIFGICVVIGIMFLEVLGF